MLALIIDLGWKSALIAGLALLANHGLRLRAPGERVALLRAAVAALLMLPVLAFAVPALEIAVLPALDPAPPASVAAAVGAPDGEAETMGSIDWLAMLYFAGAAALLLRLAAGVVTLSRWTRAAVPSAGPRWNAAMRASIAFRRPVRLLVSGHVAAPMSWGLAPAWVLIGPETERRAEHAESVIAHELAHVCRFDWPVQIAARIAALCFWFNPLVWLLTRELTRQTELAADADAVAQVEPADYAQTLLTIAGGAAHPVACGMSITHSTLGGRIRNVLDAEGTRPASRLACIAMLACLPLAAAPLAAMQFVPVAPEAPAPQEVPAPPAPVPAPAPIALQQVDLPPPTPAARAVPARPARPAQPPRRVAAVRPLPPMPPRELRAPRSTGEERVRPIAPPRAIRPPAPIRPPVPVVRPPRPPEPFAEKHRVQAAERAERAEKRGLEHGLTRAARNLRHKAERLEAQAAGPAADRREANASAAASLRAEAARLEAEARRVRPRP